MGQRDVLDRGSGIVRSGPYPCFQHKEEGLNNQRDEKHDVEVLLSKAAEGEDVPGAVLVPVLDQVDDGCSNVEHHDAEKRAEIGKAALDGGTIRTRCDGKANQDDGPDDQLEDAQDTLVCAQHLLALGNAVSDDKKQVQGPCPFRDNVHPPASTDNVHF